MGILDQFKLDGKTALVTGCRRGIGRAMAEALAEAGADIIGVSTQMEGADSQVGRAVRAVGRTFHGYACDLSDRRSLYLLIEQLKTSHPVIDILFNNAGTLVRTPAAHHADADWDRVIEVNLNAQFILAREIGGPMLERGSGKIVFTASLLTFQGGLTVPGYAASKAGVGALVKALANEWAARGVNVNGIAPGYIDTDVTTALQQDPVRNPSILARIPAGRWGTPGDLGGAAVFLASNASNYVHGEILVVDGGWMGR